MLQNEGLLAKIDVDAAENRPNKKEQMFLKFAKLPTKGARPARRTAGRRRRGAVSARGESLPRPLPLRVFWSAVSAKVCSFSAVSAPIFARKYALFGFF